MTTTTTDDRRQPATETWLDTLNLNWTYHPDLELHRVDERASRSNQARLEPIDPDVVDRYSDDYRNGDPFPPLLAVRRARSPKVVLIGGNHRHAAAVAAGHTTHPAYLIDPGLDEATAIRLAYEDNRRHGFAPSDDERIAQAQYLIDSGLTQTDAARVVGISTGKIQRARAVTEADRRARRVELPADFELLAKTARSRLNSLRSDPVFAQAAELVLDARLQTDTEVYPLVTALNEQPSDEAAIAYIATRREELDDRIRSGTLRTNRKDEAPAVTKLSSALFTIADVEADHVVAQLTALARQSMPERLLAGARRLKAIHDQIAGTKR